MPTVQNVEHRVERQSQERDDLREPVVLRGTRYRTSDAPSQTTTITDQYLQIVDTDEESTS